MNLENFQEKGKTEAALRRLDRVSPRADFSPPPVTVSLRGRERYGD